MKIIRKLKVFIITLLFLCSFLIYSYIRVRVLNTKQQQLSNKQQQTISKKSIVKKETANLEKIYISFVVCDSRLNESLNVVKSALIFTTSPIHFVIFTDEVLIETFNRTLNKWKEIRRNLEFEIHKINFPESHKKDWLNLFSKCAAQRLFIPVPHKFLKEEDFVFCQVPWDWLHNFRSHKTLLPHIDAIVYVDTDTLFLGPADELWQNFYKFNRSQISALALEDDNPNVSWYPRFAKHPFYGKYGLNSGVMLMNLTRMRTFGWVDYVTPIMLKWKLHIPWGDQDIINIIFHYHERAVYVLSCRYNYRSDQCMYGDACEDATERGVYLVHGSRKAFHSHKQPVFEAVYRAIDQYELNTNPRVLIKNLQKYLHAAPPSICGALKQAFIIVPNTTVYKIYNKPDR